MATSRGLRRFEPRLAIKIIPIAAAVLSAVLVFLLHGLADDSWQWLTLGADLIRNLFVGGLLTVAIIWLDELQRTRDQRLAAEAESQRQQRQVLLLREVAQLAANGWSPLHGAAPSLASDTPSGEVLAGEILRQADELKQSASALEEMYERQTDDEDIIFDLVELPALVRGYVLEGGRGRRYAYFDWLRSELSDIERTGDEPIPTAVREFRASLSAAVAWRLHTDATVIERLLVGKVVHGGAPLPADPEHRRLLDSVQLDAAAVACEPLYLLQAYVVVHGSGVTDLAEASRRMTPVNRCIGALRNEIRAVARALELLGRLLEVAANVDGATA